jgi:Photosynthetic reaction centre cytochrome C subunit
VECAYCHVPDHFDKDDKKPKAIARQMMRMMVAIDQNTFGGNREVTCYSCHQGSPQPQPMPSIAEPPKRKIVAASTAEQLPLNLPTAGEVLQNYIQALGGVEAIEKVTSREEIGTTTVDGKAFRIELFNQDPEKEVLIRHMPTGDAITVFNGREGWSSVPGQPVRDLHGADLDAVQIEADLRFPLHINQRFAELRVEYPETIEDRETYVISCMNVGEPPVKLYFDKTSGLLVRLTRYNPTPLGVVPVQIDFGDYRDVDGVKTPFRWTIAQPDEIATTQLERIKQNVPIEESKFLKPVAAQNRSGTH